MAKAVKIKNFKKFSKQIEKFAQNTGASVKEVTKIVALKAFESVVDKTPVDTGWALASWRFAEGGPDLSIAKKPNKNGKKATENKQTGFSAGVGKDFPTFYVTNNLFYVKFLEAGTANYVKPDSGHMVERTEILLTKYVSDAVRATE